MPYFFYFLYPLSLLLAFVTHSPAQSIAGNYSKKLDRHTVEKLKLKANYRFEYTHIGFGVVIREVGTWTHANDRLILHSQRIAPKLEVVTDYSKKMVDYDLGTVFIVKDQQGYDVEGHTLEVADQDNTFIFEKITSRYLISGNIQAFTLIDRFGYRYPKYVLKKKRNIVKITLEKTDMRIFNNEAWKLQQGKITPKNLKGEWANYQLVKE